MGASFCQQNFVPVRDERHYTINFFIIYFGSMLHYLCNTTCYYIHSLFTLLLLYVRFYVLLVILLKLVNVY